MNALTFQTRLNFNLAQLPEIAKFLGKSVIITIIEVPSNDKVASRKWNYLGAAKVGGLDNLNIRDLAYE